MDSIDSVVETLNENQKLEREECSKALEEQIRHNREMENIESEKTRVSVYDLIEKRMDLFLSSHKVFQELKETLSLEQIAQAMPSCIKCFDFASMIEQDQTKFASYYNKWAAANELSDRNDPDFCC